MDKLARRGGGAIRFNSSSSSSSSSGEFVLLEKSRKERIRKLSAIGSGGAAATSEMGCDVSDREDDELELELPSTQRFKLPRKFLDEDCNGVHLASVPRKMRSAMKKRHRESTSLSSPSSKKLMSGTESVKCDRVKKPCSKQGDRFAKETDSGPITKDEEEVAETLYALAGLVFPNHEAKSLDANASPLAALKNSPGPAVEVKDVKLDPVSSCKATRSPSPSFVEELTKGSDQIDLMNRPGTQYKLEVLNSGNLCIDSDNKVPQNQINITSLSTKVERCNEKPLGNAVNFHDRSDSSLDSFRLMQTMQQQNSAELGLNIGSQLGELILVQESKKNGSGLWPGLSSDVSHGSKNNGPILQCPVGTMPPWLDAALSTSIASVQIEPAFAKVTKVVHGRRSYKKCAAHVYISHLIQSLKSCESSDKLTLQPSQIRAPAGSNQGGFLAINTCTDVKNGFNEVVSRSTLNISSTDKVPNEAKNGTFRLRKPHLDQPLSTLASGPYSSPKQIIDFLSVSAGGDNLETNGSGRYGMKPSSQTQVPYPHSPVQNHNLIHFSLPQSRYNSSACLDSPLGAQQDQLLPSYGNRFSGTQANAMAFTKQPLQQQQLHMQQQQHQQQQLYLHLHLQQQQQQQQQQRLWAAQYRPPGTVEATAPFPSWQSVKQETSNLIQCGQPLLSPSPSTLELVGPKYAPLSQQQHQQLMAATSFPPGRINRPDHHLPSAYEESVGVYRTANAMPLQLLCHERL